jgi:hypothetical protein
MIQKINGYFGNPFFIPDITEPVLPPIVLLLDAFEHLIGLLTMAS